MLKEGASILMISRETNIKMTTRDGNNNYSR